MSGYIQIGQTAARDPITGEFLPAVPLYIRKKDMAAAPPLDDFPVAEVLGKKFGEYMKSIRKLEREAREAEAVKA